MPTTSTRSSTRCRQSGSCWTAISASSSTSASVPCPPRLCASRSRSGAGALPTCCASPTPSLCSKFFSNGMSTHGRWNSSAILSCARRSCMCSIFLSRAVLPPLSGCGTISLRRLPDARQYLAKELAERCVVGCLKIFAKHSESCS